MFRHTRADPIPDGWRVLQADVDTEHFKAGAWYAEGTKPHCGARRYKVNRLRDCVLVPVGPWIASWYDCTGKRKERSTRTTDKATGERILAKLVSEVALRRAGVIDAMQDRYAAEARKLLSEHVGKYIAHCRNQAGQDKRHVDQKERHLRRLQESTGASRLPDLTADALELHLNKLRASGLSARSVNFARQIAVAFMSWSVKTGRMPDNPLVVVPKLDESKDRRRIRRPLTDDEVARLLAMAEDHGRKAWYLTAALAGLRKGDLQRLTWADVDCAAGTITVRDGKAKREDVVPLHPQLTGVLQARKDEALAMPSAKVFPQTVTTLTTHKDFLRAGLAREETITDENGEPVMIGKGKRRRPATRIVAEDAEGRVIDLHAMRTTLGTNLARAGVAPQVAQKIMRHADYRTTLKHYTVLGLNDMAAAIELLPGITAAEAVAAKATGTDDLPLTGSPQQYPQQLGRETVRNDAARCAGGKQLEPAQNAPKTAVNAAGCETKRRCANMCGEVAGVAQLVEHQPSKLNVAGSSPVARFWLPMTSISQDLSAVSP